MIVRDCRFEPPHTHSYPDDWVFGGADGTDPRADLRWQPTTYEYLDARLQRVCLSQTPLCDDQALEEFSVHRADEPVYLQVKRPGERDMVLLDWRYDPATDTLYPLGGVSDA